MPKTTRSHAAEVLSREARILLLSAGSEPDELELLWLLRGPVDWMRLLGLAAGEKALPVVRDLLDGRDDVEMPQALREHLRRASMIRLFRQGLLEERLEEGAAALARAGIPVVLLKGAALARTVYPGFHARPMGDLDLLVPGSRSAEVLEILRALGWRSDPETWPPEAYRHHHHLPPLRDGRDPLVRLEIHTDLFVEGHPFTLGAEVIWGGSRPLRVGSAEARIPHPADHLLYVCTHFAWSHTMHKGAWLAFRDVDALARNGGIEWEGLAARARALGVGGPTYWTLHLARVLAGAPVPGEVVEELRPSRSPFLLAPLERHLVAQLLPGDRGSCPSARVRRLAWSMAVPDEGMGRGNVRPWEYRDRFLDLPDPGAANGGANGREGASIAAFFRRAAGWAGYLRALL